MWIKRKFDEDGILLVNPYRAAIPRIVEPFDILEKVDMEARVGKRGSVRKIVWEGSVGNLKMETHDADQARTS